MATYYAPPYAEDISYEAWDGSYITFTPDYAVVMDDLNGEPHVRIEGRGWDEEGDLAYGNFYLPLESDDVPEWVRRALDLAEVAS